MTAGERGRQKLARSVPAVLLGCAVVVPAALAGPATIGQLGLVLLGLIVGFAVVVLEPRWIYGALAAVLGAAPFATVPGFGQPMVLVLAAMVWGAVLTHTIAETRTSPIEITVALLTGTSIAAMVMTANGAVAYLEFVKWLLATSMVFALLRLSRRDLRMFGVVFSWAVGVGATFGLGMFLFDKAGAAMNHLSFLGYGRIGTSGTHLRFYTMENSTVVRLTGTYVDPNIAGIFLFIGLAFTLTLLRGAPRVIIAAVVAAAIIATLSRSAIFSVVVAALVYLAFQAMSSGKRLLIIALGVAAGSVALSNRVVHNRIFSSFSSSDKGSADRADALANFFDAMRGHWLLGRGWGAPEFTDEIIGYQTNYVANSPLLTVYRGGIFVGIAFVLVLVAGAVVAYRNMRKRPWESGVLGAAFIGFSVVALQLDFPIVTHAPMTMVFSVFLAFLAADLTSDPDRRDADRPSFSSGEPGDEQRTAVDGKAVAHG